MTENARNDLKLQRSATAPLTMEVERADKESW